MAAKIRLLHSFAPVFGAQFAILYLGMAGFAWQDIEVAPASVMAYTAMVAVALALVLAAFHWGQALALSSALTAALFLVMPAPLAVFSYAATGLGGNFPLVDASLAHLDALLGLERMVAASAPASALERGVAAFGPSIALVGLVGLMGFLNLIGRVDRILECAWLLMGSCVAGSVIAMVWPAEGASAFFAQGVSSGSLRTAAVASGPFTALRQGDVHLFSLGAAEMVVQFPSPVAGLALLGPLALRGFGLLTRIAALLAGLGLLALLLGAGHYLADVLAGSALMLAGFALLRLSGASAGWRGLMAQHGGNAPQGSSVSAIRTGWALRG